MVYFIVGDFGILPVWSFAKWTNLKIQMLIIIYFFEAKSLFTRGLLNTDGLFQKSFETTREINLAVMTVLHLF